MYETKQSTGALETRCGTLAPSGRLAALQVVDVSKIFEVADRIEEKTDRVVRFGRGLSTRNVLTQPRRGRIITFAYASRGEWFVYKK